MFGGSTQHLPKCEAYFCKFLCFWANFDCCKWPNFEKLACPSGNTNALVNLTKMRFSGPTFSTQTAVVEVDLAKRTGFGPVMGNFNRTIMCCYLYRKEKKRPKWSITNRFFRLGTCGKFSQLIYITRSFCRKGFNRFD